jgi:putative ABC transport system permease protein
MKAILRNFISIIRRYKLAATLNILGLSVAFAAFMVIMIQLDWDWSFDKFHKESDKIFRVEVIRENSATTQICRPLAERFFESSPHILAGAIIGMEEKAFFYVENGDMRYYFTENKAGVLPEYTDIFSFDFIEGVQEALKIPGMLSFR